MRFTESYLGVSSARDDALEAISPLAHASEADAPILLIHGDKDTVVPIAQSEDVASALKHAGKTVDFVELDGEDHWLSRSATRLQMLKTMMAFVEKYNPPDLAPTR
jgi:dipeptidyl aminopeptidase/acylaminoacyl peptidase